MMLSMRWREVKRNPLTLHEGLMQISTTVKVYQMMLTHKTNFSLCIEICWQFEEQGLQSSFRRQHLQCVIKVVICSKSILKIYSEWGKRQSYHIILLIGESTLIDNLILVSKFLSVISLAGINRSNASLSYLWFIGF